MHTQTLYPRKQLVFLLMAFILIFTGCEKADDEPSNGSGGSSTLTLSCSGGGPLPTYFQCLKNAAGQSAPTTYKISEVIGSWNSSGYDFCVTYLSNGTGVIKYKPSAFSPGSTQNIKWGALVDSKGELVPVASGTILIVHQSTSSTPVDPQIAGIGFKRSTGQWSFDLKKVSSCN